MVNHVSTKTCYKCKQNKPLVGFGKNKNTKDGLQVYCKDCVRQGNRDYYRQHRAERIASTQTAVRRLKKEVISAYGGRCQCCGEEELTFLAIDHENGGGNKHREEEFNGFGGAHFYRWLRRRGYPSGYRVLCHNCNWATAWGTCPHQEKR